MLKLNNRQNLIYELIQSRKAIDVNLLAKEVNVSSVTIRKDLSILQSEGLIYRTRGEAHIAITDNELSPYDVRFSSNSIEKSEVAKLAAAQINDGENIILDSGTTTYEIATRILDKRNITVITNSLPIALLLDENDIRVMVTGGINYSRNKSLHGPDAIGFLRKIQADKAFISSVGVRGCEGLTSTNPMESSMKQAMIHSAKKVFATIDSSKLSIGGLELFTEFSEIDYFITNKLPKESELYQTLTDLNIKIITADS